MLALFVHLLDWAGVVLQFEALEILRSQTDQDSFCVDVVNFDFFNQTVTCEMVNKESMMLWIFGLFLCAAVSLPVQLVSLIHIMFGIQCLRLDPFRAEVYGIVCSLTDLTCDIILHGGLIIATAVTQSNRVLFHQPEMYCCLIVLTIKSAIRLFKKTFRILGTEYHYQRPFRLLSNYIQFLMAALATLLISACLDIINSSKYVHFLADFMSHGVAAVFSYTLLVSLLLVLELTRYYRISMSRSWATGKCQTNTKFNRTNAMVANV